MKGVLEVYGELGTVCLLCMLGLSVLLCSTPIASADVLENTTVNITPQIATSITTIQYTDNDSQNLLSRIDQRGDNNSYVNAWEVLKHEVEKRREILKNREYIIRLKNNSWHPQVDVSTTHEVLGNTSAPRRITMFITQTSTLGDEFPLRLNITAPDNHTLILVQSPLRIERLTPQIEIRDLPGYHQLTPPANTTVMLTLNLSTPPQRRQGFNETGNSPQREPQIHRKKGGEERTSSIIFIISILFILLIILLIILHRKL